MDLYEALKAGTSKEQLQETFKKELEEATMRLAAEAAETETLNNSREKLIDAIIDYTQTYYNEQFDTSNMKKYINKILLEYEKDLDNWRKIDKPINTHKIKKKPTDDDIIFDFIKNLL